MSCFFALALLAGRPALAGSDASPPAILEAARVPHLGPAGQDDYRRFLAQATPRAFALSPDGAYGWAAALETEQAAADRATAICTSLGGRGCRLYARDLDVVWPGQESASPRVPEQPLRIGPGWALTPDARFFRQGPRTARGAYVWAHGRAVGGADSRGSQPQPHVRMFNNAGWDVLRFDRAPATDETDAAARWLRDAVATLREAGYARIVVGGQSRGAWNALQALADPGLVDGVVAVAPAAHGPPGSPARAHAVADLHRVVTEARSPAARVIVATFTDDEYDPDPERRSAVLRGLRTPRVGGMLFLDRPPEVQGHGGGADARFTLRYGACLLAFIERRAERCD